MISSVLREFAYSQGRQGYPRAGGRTGAPCANFYGNNTVSLVFYAPY